MSRSLSEPLAAAVAPNLIGPEGDREGVASGAAGAGTSADAGGPTCAASGAWTLSAQLRQRRSMPLGAALHSRRSQTVLRQGGNGAAAGAAATA
eukprot:CAMPEP_0204521566 /NCGR_PEP_ID=MMETSP0661-20131031/5855_1 /ASSEMBLY_ACC=CAM_ASM_000606 /TAXON_ID=109239 /ORGANISM="Alexandrium margalefi, Strain AMGDE01CS-322" /LENGTH=93 /DNA_ID=CAMNT_0051527173 /DNA_START=329 /DNA_END=607 /DNA_ORIENTATION=+